MTRGNYDVEQAVSVQGSENSPETIYNNVNGNNANVHGASNNTSVSKDMSFRSIICALLLFFGICVIILLLTWPWKIKSQFDSEIIEPRPNDKAKSYHRTEGISTTEINDPNNLGYDTTTIRKSTSEIIEHQGHQHETSTSTNSINEEHSSYVVNSESSTNPTTATSTVIHSEIFTHIKTNDDETTTIYNINEDSTSFTNKESIEKIYSTDNEISNSVLEDFRTIKDSETTENNADQTTQTTQTITDNSEDDMNETTISSITEMDDDKFLRNRREITTIASKIVLTSTVTVPTVSKFKEHKPVCLKEECKSIATRILSQINHSVDPCEDFYDYACGGYNFDNEYEENLKRIDKKYKTITDTDALYLRTFKNVYDNCLSFHENYDFESRLFEAKKIFNSVGQLYDRNGFISNTMNLTELLSTLLEMDFSPLFDVTVDVDKQTKKFVFQINLGRRSKLLQGNNNEMTKLKIDCIRKQSSILNEYKINLNEVYNKYVECQNDHSVYLQTVQKALHNFGVFSDLDDFNRTQYFREALSTIELNILDTLKFLPSAGNMRKEQISKKYDIIKIADLQQKYPFIQWCTLFSKISGRLVDRKDRVQIYFYHSYFKNLLTELNSLQLRTLHNAIMSLFAEELYSNLVLPQINEKPERHCLKQTSLLLKDISSSIYLNTWSENDITLAQWQLNETFSTLKTNLKTMMESSEWLDDSSRDSLKLKTNNLQVVTDGTIDIWKNESFLNMRIETISKDTNYQNQIIALMKRHRKFMFDLWGNSALNSENLLLYYLTPYDIRPVSIYALGLIVTPLGMVLNLKKNIPKYIKKTKLDYQLMRELAHHFDSNGKTYDMDLSRLSEASYNQMQNCIMDKYNLFSQIVNNKNLVAVINTTLSLEERIVEDTALLVMEYMRNDTLNDDLLPWISETFSSEKIFFLSLIQNHCKHSKEFEDIIDIFESEYLNPRLLVQNFLSHSHIFGSTFNCKAGSGMNPPIKCDRFPNLIKDDYYDDSNITN